MNHAISVKLLEDMWNLHVVAVLELCTGIDWEEVLKTFQSLLVTTYYMSLNIIPSLLMKLTRIGKYSIWWSMPWLLRWLEISTSVRQMEHPRDKHLWVKKVQLSPQLTIIMLSAVIVNNHFQFLVRPKIYVLCFRLPEPPLSECRDPKKFCCHFVFYKVEAVNDIFSFS